MGLIELAARDAINDIKSAPQTFSSWDSCMQKNYCKWPAIVGIVIGSIIILSILFCCVRCLCCGLECCCGCFTCFNHCCPSPRNKKRSKYAEGPSYAPNAYQGYQPAPRAPPVYEAPQYAQFDASSKKVHEDSLPAMPSWDNASTRKVEDSSPRDDMEMNSMNNKGSTTGLGAAAAAGAGAGAAGAAGRQYHQARTNPNSPNPYASSNAPRPYGQTSPTNAYGGAMGTPRAQDYQRPSPVANNSYASQPSSVYSSQQNGPTSQTRPAGGFRNPPSSDQFQSSAIAPTPNQYGSGAYGGQTNYSGSTRYEPSNNHYGQESGVTQASPTSPRSDGRPPSILQAGRKPAPGTWRDV